ncbi:MAG: glycosyltransferase family 9 protein [Actinomycetota bacterium]|nr:glycosyltransferase family 9 protein [Actinomycetota bacterium]
MTGSPAIDWAAVRRVLVVRLDNIGDVVLLGPALRTLRANLPQARQTLLCSPVGAQVAPLLPWVDDVVVRRVVWQDASGTLPLDPDRELDLVSDLRAGAFDAAVIFTSFAQSPFPPAYACYLAGIAVRVGQSTEFGGSLLSHPVPAAPYEAHQVERSLRLLEGVGLRRAGEELELRVRPEDLAAARSVLARAGVPPATPYVMVAPGASCPSRRYEAGRFASAVKLLARHLPVVVVGSAKERELAARISAGIPGAVTLAGQTDLPALAGITQGAALVVTNNSASMHLADALRRPLVVLFAGTELESQFAPCSTPSRLLRRPTDCSPCHAFVCPYVRGRPTSPPGPVQDRDEGRTHLHAGEWGGPPCLDVSPTEVANAAFELLAGVKSERSESSR